MDNKKLKKLRNTLMCDMCTNHIYGDENQNTALSCDCEICFPWVVCESCHKKIRESRHTRQ